SLSAELHDDRPSVPADRFAGPVGHGGWAPPPGRWGDHPEGQALSGATVGPGKKAQRTPPEKPRRVTGLRDMEGWSSQEVRDLLDRSEVNQRVLLHRARSRVRAALEGTMGAEQ